MLRKLVHISYLLIYAGLRHADAKYVEGELHTSENWAFISRFCFLSEEGQFEYYIEYNEDQGEPNVLLYYDADDQWPAVYKSNKTCQGREAVLNVQQNQILNLTTRFPSRELSGCMTTPVRTTQRPKYTLIMPTLAKRRRLGTKPSIALTTAMYEVSASGTPISTSKTEYSTNSEMEISASKEESSTQAYYTSTGGTSVATDEVSTVKTYGRMEVTTMHGSLLEDTLTGVSSGTTPQDVEDIERSKPIKKRSANQGQAYNAARIGRTIVCRNARRFRSSRERWWFIAVSNCNGSKGIHIRYRMLMTNGPSGDYWHEHFSADEFYILPVLMAFCIAYSLLLLAIIICSIELKSRQLLHSTYKLFVMSVFVQFFGVVFKSLAYLKYAVNGVGAPKLKTAGNVFMGSSETCFLLLLLLLAKGYTVTRGRLPLSGGIKLTIFMCLYVVTYMSLFIYEAKVFDPGEVLYTYESPAGYGLIVLRIIAWCMFIYSTVFTLKHYPEKANFYYPFNVLGTLWFIAGPAFIISANTYIDKWVRESVVCAVLLFITFGGHVMFLLLTMPSVANKNFPYHVRTTQIGVMELTGNAGNSSIEQFGHHIYEPTTNIEQTVIIPLSRRTEEIFGGLYSQHVHTTLRGHHRDGERDAPPIPRNPNDMIMENVLSWSIAKNFSGLDVAHFDKVIRSNLGSAHSRVTEGSEAEERGRLAAITNGGLASAPEMAAEQNGTDWVRDVPVELFTISKMVVARPNGAQRQKHEDSD